MSFIPLIIFLGFLLSIKSQGSYDYSIEVPKFSCDKESLKTGVTAIKVQGKDVGKLQFKFSVNYKVNDNCKNTQRCNLMAWKAVRDLEKCFNGASNEEINVNNTLLVPSVRYVLNVTVLENGTKVDGKELMFECSNTSSSIIQESHTEESHTEENLQTEIPVEEPNTEKYNAEESSTEKPDQEESHTDKESETGKSQTKEESQTQKLTTEESTPEEQVETSQSEPMTHEEPTTTTEETQTESAMLVEKPQPVLRLLGSNTTYPDMMYILNAETTNVEIGDSYYYSWEIMDKVQNIISSSPFKGSELQIYFDQMDVTEECVIKCSLINLHKNSVAVALQNVNILQRDMILKFAVSVLAVGLKQPFVLKAYIKYVDVEDKELNITFSCRYENRRPCSGFQNSRFNYQKKIHLISLECRGFIVVGRYNITLTVDTGIAMKEVSCVVEVIQDAAVQIDVDNVDLPINPLTEIEVPVYVSKLSTGCWLQWKSVTKAPYEYLDLNTVPGNINALLNITVTEDEFLNEIDEYSNETKDLDCNLKIPAPKDEWKGLQLNTFYLFRLNITCPVDVNDEDYDSVDDAEPLLLQAYVSVYADVPLHVGSVPVSSLDVDPKEGAALQTLFTFSCEAGANDTSYPVLYKFGYFLDNQVIFFSNLLEVTNTTSVLPFQDRGVQTVLESCNSYSLCARTFGPVVNTVVSSEMTKEESNLQKQLEELMKREEYYKFFTFSLAVVQTFNNTDSGSSAMHDYVSTLTSNEIKRLLMQNIDGEKNWKTPANNLLKNVGILLNNSPTSARLLNNVVALRNELSRANSLQFRANTDTYFSRKLLGFGKSRFKREVERSTLEEVKSYLIISELIITTSPDKKRVAQERENLLNQIDKFMQGLCATLYEKSQTMNLELKTMIMSVEKLSKTTNNKYIHILYNDNTWNINGRIKLGKCYYEKLKVSGQLCIGKIALRNYLDKKGIVHVVKIYSTDSDDQLLLEDIMCDSILLLPVDEKQTASNDPMCEYYWRRHWSQFACKTLQITKTIQCSCNNLGYYSLQYYPRVSTIEVTTPKSLEAAEVDMATEKIETETNVNQLESSVITTTLSIGTINTQNYVNNITILTFATTSFINDETLVTVTEEAISDNRDTVIKASIHAEKGNGDIVLYCITGFSTCGIVAVLFAVKKLLTEDNSMVFPNFPEYARLYHEEMLDDLPQTSHLA